MFPEKDLGKGARETLTVQISVIHLYTALIMDILCAKAILVTWHNSMNKTHSIVCMGMFSLVGHIGELESL